MVVFQILALIPLFLLIIFEFPHLLRCAEFEAAAHQEIDFDSVDANKDGSIAKTEFVDWCENGGKINFEKCQQFFGNYDINSDGVLTLPEFVPLALQLSRESEDKSEKIFNFLDKNADGQLTKQELEDVMDKPSFLPAVISELFHVVDTNGDGKISSAEFKSEMKNDALAQSLVAMIDVDKDQQISKDEILAYSKQFQRVLTRAEVDSAILQLDKNSDQKLSVSEVRRMPQLLQSILGIQSIPQIQ